MEALLNGLMLDVGGLVWVSGPTAAALYGFDGYELRPPFHLTIERGRDVQRVGHKIHTTKVLVQSDQTERFGFRTYLPARVLLDLARIETHERLAVAVALVLEGYVPLQFTYEDVVDRPDELVPTVLKGYASATTRSHRVVADTGGSRGRGGVPSGW